MPLKAVCVLKGEVVKGTVFFDQDVSLELQVICMNPKAYKRKMFLSTVYVSLISNVSEHNFVSSIPLLLRVYTVTNFHLSIGLKFGQIFFFISFRILNRT